jgi:hypothetical protein
MSTLESHTSSNKPQAQLGAVVSLVEHLMKVAFSANRTPRSVPYMQGAEDTLKKLAYGSASRRRYTPGTPEFDAYHSGANEGYAIWNARKAEMLRRAESAQ